MNDLHKLTFFNKFVTIKVHIPCKNKEDYCLLMQRRDAMTNNIKTYTLFVRPDNRSKEIANNFRNLFAGLSKSITETDDGDLIIAIGGDGTFLDAVSTAKFDDTKVFAGVNTGTLGFLQNISPEEFCSFIQFHSDKKELLTRKLFLPKITVKLDNNETHSFYAVNEVIIEGLHGHKISFSEYVNGDLFQRVSSNSICVACSTGDTAFSMNSGGAIDFSEHFQLVRTLVVPIQNAAYERFISNPVICPHFHFEMDASSKSEILVDGRLKTFDNQISAVDVSLYGAHYIHKLELGSYSKVNTVRSKILGYN